MRRTISDTGELHPALADTVSDTERPRTPASDLTGTTIGRYRVVGRLGEGGMGVVYAAVDPALDRKVALKVLPQIAGEDAAATDARARLEARLRREAQALAKLDHPNVVGVFDVGITAETVFVAMQLVDGTTLEDYLDTAKPSVRQILALFVAAGRGLAAAHAAGLVHRDVKPSNILVDRAGHAYIGDFGLARGTDELDPATSQPYGMLRDELTRAGSVLGTPRFMSPEQHAGQPATARSDQYSFCLALWSALHGEHPFATGAKDSWTAEVALAKMTANQIREPGTRPVPARVTRALVRGMQFAEAARWPSMDALLAAIAPRSRRAWLFGAAAIVAVGAAVAATMVAMRAPDAHAGCALEAGAIAAVWPAGREAALADKDPDHRLRSALADYAKRWREARASACESEGPAQRAAAQCLDADLRIFRETADELAAATGPRDINKLVAILPPVEDCSSVAQAALPPIPEHAVAKVAELRAQIARAYRLETTRGDPARARVVIATVVADARSLGYVPVLAEALVAKAYLELGESDPAATASASEAAELAVTVHADRTATQAYAIGLIDAVGRPDLSRVETLLPVARATAMRTGDPAGLASFDHAGAWGYRALGRYDAAEAACRDALAQAAKLDEERGAAIRDDAYGCLAETFVQRGNGKEALRWVDDWTALVVKRFGEGQLGTRQALRTKVSVLQLLGQYDAAIALNERVLAIATKAYGGDHITMLDDRFVQVRLLRGAGRVPEAMAEARRALALVDRAPASTDVRTRVLAEETLAELLGMSGDHAAMYEHYETALAAAEGSLTGDDDRLASLRYHYGLALFEDNHHLERADELFGKATTAWQHLRSTKQYYAEIERAMLREQQGHCDEAIPMYAHVVAGAPPGVQHMKGQLGLGDCLAQQGDLARARVLFATVAREGPTLPGGPELAKVAADWIAEHGAPP